jgi:hypothetical protein
MHNVMTDMDMQQESCRLKFDYDDPSGLGSDLSHEERIVLIINHDLQQKTPVLYLVGELVVDPPKLITVLHKSVFKQQSATTSLVFNRTALFNLGPTSISLRIVCVLSFSFLILCFLVSA